METSLTYEDRICQCDFIWERFKKYLELNNIINYTNVQVWISEGQKDKFKKAFESNCESITIRLTFTDLHGEAVIILIKSQLDRLMKAYDKKERHDHKNVENTIGSQYQNRRRIFKAKCNALHFALCYRHVCVCMCVSVCVCVCVCVCVYAAFVDLRKADWDTDVIFVLNCSKWHRT